MEKKKKKKKKMKMKKKKKKKKKDLCASVFTVLSFFLLPASLYHVAIVCFVNLGHSPIIIVHEIR